MAGKGKILKNDLAEFDEIVRGFEAVTLAIQKSEKTYSAYINTIAKLKSEANSITTVTQLAEANNKLTTSVQGISREQQKLTLLEKERIKIEQQQAQVMAKVLASGEQNNKILQKGKVLLAEKNKQAKQEAQYARAAAGSYEMLNIDLNKNIAAYKKLSAEQRANAQIGGKLIQSIRGQQTQIKKLDATLGNHQRNVGNYGSALNKVGGVLKGLAAGFGAVAVIRGIGRAFSSSIKFFGDFEEKMGNLKALTGLTGDKMEYLGNKAKEASVKTTKEGVRIKQSAQDILDAYTMVGSQRPELLKNAEALAAVTEKAIVLSEAGKMDLEPAVKAVTGSLNQFNLNADQTDRIINAIAAGSQAGAADIPYLTEAIDKTGTAMKLMNIEFENGIGIIEAVAPNFTNAAVAGNSLDKVLLKMKEGQIGYTDGVFNMDTAINQLKERFAQGESAASIFGVEHAKMVEVLISKQGDVKKYTEAVTGTNKAFEQAAINTDNVKAKFAQFKNQMSILATNLGERLAPAAGNAAEKFGKMAATVARWVSIKTSEKLQQEQVDLKVLENRITDANIKQADRVKLIKQLQEKYPAYLGNLDAEKVTNQELKTALKEVNDELVKKIQIQIAQEEVDKQAMKTARAANQNVKAQIDMEKQLASIATEYNLTLDTTNKSLAGRIKETLRAMDAKKKEILQGRTYLSLSQEEGVEYNRLNLLQNGLINSTKELVGYQKNASSKQDNLNVSTNEYDAILQKLGISLDANAGALEANAGALDADADAVNAAGRSINDINEDISKYNEIINKTTSAKERLEAQNMVKTLEKEKKALLGDNDEGIDVKKKTVGIINLLNEEIEKNNKLIGKSTDKSGIEQRVLENRNGLLKGQIENIKNYGEAMDSLKPRMTSDFASPIEKMTQTLANMPRNIEPGIDDTVTLIDRLKELTSDDLKNLGNELLKFSNTMLDVFSSEYDAEMAIFDARAENSRARIDDLRSELDTEIQLKEEGKANNIDLIKRQIEEEKIIEAKALADREKVEAQQRKLDNIKEISNLFVISSDIIKGYTAAIPVIGSLLGIAAVATFLTAYASQKAKIRKMEKQKFATGIYDYRGEGTEKSDDNQVWISDHESIVHAEGTKKAPKALKGIINEGWTDKDFGLSPTTKWFSDPRLLSLNFPGLDLRMNEFSSLRDEMTKNVLLTKELLSFFKTKEDIIFHPVTGEKYVKQGNCLKKYIS